MQDRIINEGIVNIPANSNKHFDILDNQTLTVKGTIGQNTNIRLTVRFNAEVILYCNIGENVRFNIEGLSKKLSKVVFILLLPYSVKQKIQIERVSVWENAENITDYINARMQLEGRRARFNSHIYINGYLGNAFNTNQIVGSEILNNQPISPSVLNQINNLNQQTHAQFIPIPPTHPLYNLNNIQGSHNQPVQPFLNNNWTANQQLHAQFIPQPTTLALYNPNTIPGSHNQPVQPFVNNNLTANQQTLFSPMPQISLANHNLAAIQQPQQQETAYSPFLSNYLDSFKDKVSNTSKIEKLNLTPEVEDRAFKGCMCSISKNVMDKPVILHGNRYDFEFLEHWIKQQPSTNLKDPISKVTFTLAEIVPDRETNQKIEETINKINAKQEKDKAKQQCKENIKENNDNNNHPDDNNEDHLNQPAEKRFKIK